MKNKEKRLEYARQYQNMSASEWWKVDFSDENKIHFKRSRWISEVLAHKKISRRELFNKS